MNGQKKRMDMMKTATIDIDTSTIAGIRRAERAKARLENAGWRFSRTVVLGLDKFRSVYHKPGRSE